MERTEDRWMAPPPQRNAASVHLASRVSPSHDCCESRPSCLNAALEKGRHPEWLLQVAARTEAEAPRLLVTQSAMPRSERPQTPASKVFHLSDFYV